MPVSGAGQGHLGPSLGSPWSPPLLLLSKTAELCHTLHVFGDGMGSHPERKAPRGSECLGRAEVLPTSNPSIHPNEGTYPRPGAWTLSGHDRVLFYWEETSVQEVRCGQWPE